MKKCLVYLLAVMIIIPCVHVKAQNSEKDSVDLHGCFTYFTILSDKIPEKLEQFAVSQINIHIQMLYDVSHSTEMAGISFEPAGEIYLGQGFYKYRIDTELCCESG